MNSRTFESVWYFESTIIQSICSNQERVCFGTVSSGFYYNDTPVIVGHLTDFLEDCDRVSGLLSTSISDICTTSSGFFIGGDGGVNSANNFGSGLKVRYYIVCSGVIGVEYSYETDTYYWATANKVYCADTCE